ncbi:hypothetical protein F0562_011980 [Nyssa sinensis]|uniref:LOB domain-containing protein n=1 Tax=Nyssa sinensis TaxID=561372 RepID=A0A5J4ZTU0_9ASTE|nr:hypothetical protein F0562_011980 [Nyssa sinensis]
MSIASANANGNNNNNNNTNSSSSYSSRSGPGGSSSGSKACAACKYQRRKCAPDCALAPHFPADKQNQFLNAHKLFGVSNIMKVINSLQPCHKETAVKCMIFHADVRAADPVGGCFRVIQELQRQIGRGKAELDLVLQQLAICRAQAQEMQNQTKVHGKSDVTADPTSTVYNPMHQYNFDYHPPPFHVQPQPVKCQEQDEDDFYLEGFGVDEDIKPLFFPFDSSCSKQSFQPSEKVVLKEDFESVQQKQEQGLKGHSELGVLSDREEEEESQGRAFL